MVAGAVLLFRFGPSSEECYLVAQWLADDVLPIHVSVSMHDNVYDNHKIYTAYNTIYFM